MEYEDLESRCQMLEAENQKLKEAVRLADGYVGNYDVYGLKHLAERTIEKGRKDEKPYAQTILKVLEDE